MLEVSRSPVKRVRRLDGLRILIVDDAPDNQILFSMILSQYGAVVETADNGRDAVRMASERAYDAVLMDLQMPIMDGYEATAALRARGYTKAIIALTAISFRDERQRCLTIGFDDHVAKPVDRLELLSALLKLQPDARQRTDN